MIRSSIVAAALLLAAASGATAQTASGSGASEPEGSGVRFSGDHAFRSFSCRGGDAVISGDGNQLKLTDCSRLTLSGAKNQISIVLSSPGDITVSGSHNAVRYRAPDDGAPNITDNGQDDDIRPTAG